MSIIENLLVRILGMKYNNRLILADVLYNCCLHFFSFDFLLYLILVDCFAFS